MTKKFGLIFKKQDLESESLEEIFRERATFFFSQKKRPNFWIIVNPLFFSQQHVKKMIQNSRTFENLTPSTPSTKNEKVELACILSIDPKFIQWLELRIGSFEKTDQTQDLEDLGQRSEVSEKKKGLLIQIESFQ